MSVVLFLSGRSMGDALAASGRAFQGIFEQLGHEFVEINLSEADAFARLNRIITSTPIEFALSHVGMAADITGQTSDKREINLWMGNGIPFISFFGDSPAYFFDRHIVPGPSFACLYAFPEHYEYRKALPMQKGFLGVTPLKVIDETPKGRINFGLKASGKLLFLKNGNDPDALVRTWRESFPLNIFLMLTDVANHLISQMQCEKACDIDALVCAYFKNRGLDIEAMTALRLLFVAQLDDYLRRVKSTLMAQVLRNFPVEIHGYNWEHVDFSGSRAKFIHGADYTASKQLITEALGVVDMSPNTSRSPHDRALRAYGLYTLCLTNEQEFFSQHFDQHRNFTFRFERESLENKIAEVIAHPKRFIELGIEVAEQFRKRFDSEAFGRTLLDIAACLRLASGRRPANMQEFFVWPPGKLT